MINYLNVTAKQVTSEGANYVHSRITSLNLLNEPCFILGGLHLYMRAPTSKNRLRPIYNAIIRMLLKYIYAIYSNNPSLPNQGAASTAQQQAHA